MTCESNADCVGLGAGFACTGGFCRQGAASVPQGEPIEVDAVCDMYVADARFTATLRGTPTTDSPLRAAPAALRSSLLIRAHGVWLWLRRLPVRPRPTHHQEGVSPR